MKTRTYEVAITGETPLLMHADNLEWKEIVEKWCKDPANKKLSVKGDDRSPAWTWLSYLYRDGGCIVMPSDNLMTMLREGGAKCPLKGNTTFKSMTQSGIQVNEVAWPIHVNGNGTIATDELDRLIEEPTDFALHEEAAKAHGFELFAKRATVGQSKHVRVRPRFHNWSCTGTLTVFEELITTEVLNNVITFGGAYSGLGDWRPSSKKPGPYGRFTAKIKEVK